MLQVEKPQLNPHPLSPYVAWAGQRNREPILNLLKTKLPETEGQVLELASGSGMHLHYFAPHFSHLTFQPTDVDEAVFDHIQQLTAKVGVQNVLAPLKLDLTQPEAMMLPTNQFDAMFCINLFQVAPVSVADGMMRCAEKLLSDRGFLMIYGPFKVEGEFTTFSNEEFDSILRSHGVSEWGLKDTADLNQAARKYGLALKELINMPANNFALIYSRV